MKKKLMVATGVLALYSGMSSYLLLRQEAEIYRQENVVKKTSGSIVSLEDAGGRGRGTGFFAMTASGNRVIVTNAHVCEINPQSPIFVVYHRTDNSLRKKAKFPVVALQKDTKSDLCIVSAPIDCDAPALTLADEVKIDSHVYIVGYPIVALLSSSDGYIRGYDIADSPYELPLDLCVGEKHYIKTVPIKQGNRKSKLTKQCFFRAKMIFTDALGDHGQSGSPGLNGKGEVIGVMSMISGQARPFAFLVPLDALKEFLSKN